MSEAHCYADAGQQSAAVLTDILHLVALFGCRSVRIFNDASAHQHVGLAQNALCYVLYVEIEAEHPAFEVIVFVYADVKLGKGIKTFGVKLRIVVIRSSLCVPCLHERRLVNVIRRIRTAAYRTQLGSYAPVARQLVGGATLAMKRLSHAELMYPASELFLY